MRDRAVIGREVRDHFEEKWSRGDPWDLGSSDFEGRKYARQRALLGDRRYGRSLEIGCGSGHFSRMLASVSDRVVALDIAPTAIEVARAAGDAEGRIEFRVANAVEFDLLAEGPWDLVVMSETLPYLGWLYSMFEVAWFATQIHQSTRAGGRFLMANTCGGVRDYLLRPWLIHTYRDLFRNVGYRLEAEETFRGTKDETEIDSLLSLFRRETE